MQLHLNSNIDFFTVLGSKTCVPQTMALHSNVILAVVVVGIFNSVFSWEAILYDRIGHQGPKVEVSGPDDVKTDASCIDLKTLTYCRGRNGDCSKSVPVSTAVSSIDTKQNCVKVYGDPSCKRLLSKIQPGTGCHANLGRDCPSLNNKIQSISGC